MTEIEYRYTHLCQKNKTEPNNNLTRVDKMRELGKVYLDDNYTVFDFKKGTGVFLLSNNDHNSEASYGNGNSFPSIRTLNSCLTKGRWCYETQIITNRLRQIGWATLHTPFTGTNGVGDDPTSYAFDGYRNCSWNSAKQIVYGDLWDIGKKHIIYITNLLIKVIILDAVLTSIRKL